MRRVVHGLGLASIAALLTVGVVAAAPPNTGCPAGPSNTGGPVTISAWELYTRDELIAGAEAAGYPNPDAYGPVFDTTNRNGDEFICVQMQVLPNDASGFTTFFNNRDNVVREP